MHSRRLTLNSATLRGLPGFTYTSHTGYRSSTSPSSPSAFRLLRHEHLFVELDTMLMMQSNDEGGTVSPEQPVARKPYQLGDPYVFGVTDPWEYWEANLPRIRRALTSHNARMAELRARQAIAA